jgi:endonuclease G
MGFDPDFIQGREIPLPTLGERVKETAFNDGASIDHARFSIVFNTARGFAVYAAHNIDGAAVIPEGEIPRRDRFRLDPDVPSAQQVDNDRGYVNNPWDRGHLVRRHSLHWRDRAEAELADSESFFWTNITPQHENLHDTAWGSIEDWMLEFADDNDKQASIFTGPVLTPDDPEHQNKPGEAPIKIPAGFWKILAIKHGGDLRAAGFLVWQRDFDKPTPVAFDPLLEQVRLTTIEYLTGLSFGDLRDADPLRFGVQFADFAARRGLLSGTARRRASVITRPRDIVL